LVRDFLGQKREADPYIIRYEPTQDTFRKKGFTSTRGVKMAVKEKTRNRKYYHKGRGKEGTISHYFKKKGL